MTPKQVGEILVDEMIEDFDRLAEYLERFADRWETYGKQYSHLISEEKKQEIEAAVKRFHERLGVDY